MILINKKEINISFYENLYVAYIDKYFIITLKQLHSSFL